MKIPFRPVTLVAIFAALAGCSSSYDEPPMPNGDMHLADLSDSQRAELCDNIAALRGGYGASTREGCGASEDSVTTNAPVSQSACVSTLESIKSTCQATVSDAIACTDDTKDPCSTQTPASCAPLQNAACNWAVTPSNT